MLRDRIGQTSTTQGTGTYELTGQLLKHRTFASQYANGAKVVYYAERDNTWEANEGTLTIPGIGNPTLSRDRLIASSTGAVINWPDNAIKNVIVDVPAELFGPLGGQLITAAAGGTANAITLSTNVATPVFRDGMTVEFEATAAPTGAVTAALNTLPAKAVLHKSGDQANAGSWEAGARLRLVADQSLDAWILMAGERPGWNVGADIASAATLVKPANARDGSYHRITGAVAVANLWTGAPPGIEHEFLVVTGFTITNGANLICPGGANIAAAANDRFRVRHLGSNVWAITRYTRADGKALIETVQPQVLVARYYGEYTTNADLSATIPLDDTIPTNSEGTEIIAISGVVVTGTQRVRVRASGYGAAATSNGRKIMALFRDTTCINAGGNQEFGATVPGPDVIEVEEAPGAGTYTYRLRAGAHTGNMRFNGNVGGRLFGGASRVTLVVQVFNP